MLTSLHLKDVGPASRLDLELGERLNVLTGDNGLGKSFVLEVAWWALTRTWIDRPVLPQQGKEDSAEIAGELQLAGLKLDRGSDEMALGEEARDAFKGMFNRVARQWRDIAMHRGKVMHHQESGRLHLNSDVIAPAWLERAVPVLYVRTNGAFSLWDPARSFALKDGYSPEIISVQPYHFDERELWDRLDRDGKTVCNGLITDWVTWQLEAESKQGDAGPFQLLCRILERLSHPDEKMTPGKPVRLYLDDVRRFPTVELPYETLPVVHASAGMKRILGLSYLLAWAWTEHVQASQIIGWSPATRIDVLLEEPEVHLHPKWQRHIVPALLDVLGGLAPGMRPQMLLTTHSPLVLASIEPHFKPAKDKLFLFELSGREVILRDMPWTKRGDAIGWLTSPVFGLDQARSIEAERAIEAAEALMRGEMEALPDGLRTEDEIHRELLRVLPDQDRFWPRWIVRRERSAP